MESKHAFFIEYGKKPGMYANVTYSALMSCARKSEDGKLALELPACDVQRAGLLGDPMYGVVKEVVVHDATGRRVVPSTETVRIPLDTQNPTVAAFLKWRDLHPTSTKNPFSQSMVQQLQCIRHIPANACVLQMEATDGGALAKTLAHLVLKDANSQLAVCETRATQVDAFMSLKDSDPKLADSKFASIALGDYPLIRRKDALIERVKDAASQPGDEWVCVMTLPQLQRFTQMRFDTLILAGTDTVHRIMQAFGPPVFEGLHLLIMTNDYSTDAEMRQAYVASLLESIGFVSIDTHLGGNNNPCFYQVWQQRGPCTIHR